MTPIVQDDNDIIKENIELIKLVSEKCHRCDAPEVGAGLHGELCAICDNDMRKQCMDNPYVE